MEGVLLVDVTTVRAWIDEASKDIEENKYHLTHLDSAIGDADHGVNLVRGFHAVGVALDEKQPATPGALLTAVGNTLVSKVGGVAFATDPEIAYLASCISAYSFHPPNLREAGAFLLDHELAGEISLTR